MSMTPHDYSSQRAALLAQIIEINLRNRDEDGCTLQPNQRGDADNLRLMVLSIARDELDVRFDAVNPPTTCPICGESIPASRDGECINATTWRHVSP